MVLCLAVQRKHDEGGGGGSPIRQVPPLDSTNRILKEKLSAEDYGGLSALRERLLEAQRQFGDYITPDKFPVVERPQLHAD